MITKIVYMIMRLQASPRFQREPDSEWSLAAFRLVFCIYA